MKKFYSKNFLLRHEKRLLPVKKFTNGSIKFLCVFPDYYKYGLPNIGLQTIYRECYRHPNVLPDRYYLPYPNMRNKEISWEQNIPIKDFDIIGFSIAYEGSFLNILRCLEYFHLSLKSSDRNTKTPLIIGGGVIPSYNPLPLSIFFDAFVLGEAEQTIHELLSIYNNNKNSEKYQILKKIATLQGIYVPAIHKINSNISSTAPVAVSKEPAYSIFLSKYTVYNEEVFSIEIRRGCNQKCRFCYMGTRLRPARTITEESFKNLVNTASHYSKIVNCFYEGLETEIIEQYLNYISMKKLHARIGSQRLEFLSETIIDIIANSKQRKLTIAPENSERMRKILGKEQIKNEDIINFVTLACKKGIADIGLYFIIGLPSENSDDLDEIINIILQVRQCMDDNENIVGQLEIGINPIYPKPFTALQFCGAVLPDVANYKLNYIVEKLSRSHNIIKTNDVVDERIKRRDSRKYITPKSVIKIETTIGSVISFTQPILSFGDEKLGNVLLEMLNKKDTIENWIDLFKKYDIQYERYYKEKSIDEIFPWHFQRCHVSNKHLIEEYLLSKKFLPSPICGAVCSECKNRCLW